MVVVCGWFLFFKQKTAYELRISDWSSDVCSSDLVLVVGGFAFGTAETAPQLFQRAQRLGLGFGQQAAMNDGLAVAVDGDDGTGHLAHLGGIALQGVPRVLQFADHLIAPLFPFLGLGPIRREEAQDRCGTVRSSPWVR